MNVSVRIFLIWFAVTTVTIGVTYVLVDRYNRPGIEISVLQDVPITVALEGEVNQPGVFTLLGNARLIDAIAAAGGLTGSADVTGLNLASRLGDGETIHIPSAIHGSPVSDDATLSTLVNINTASVAELDQLPGIGEVLAARIVEFRERFGPFTSIDQLIEIEGISENAVDELRPLVTVGG